MAIAGTTLYLAGNLFLLVGIQTATTIQHVQLRRILDFVLRDVGSEERKRQIIESAVSSVRSIRLLPGDVRGVVVRAYIDSLSWTFSMCSSTYDVTDYVF